MKKLFIVTFATFLLFAFSPTLTAQGTGYEKGKIYLDLGIGIPRFGATSNLGFAGYGYGAYGYGANSYRTPVLRANIEYGFNEFISGGLFVGYSHYGYKWTTAAGEWNDRYSTLSVGARGTFHVWDFLNETLELGLGIPELDLYVSVMAGGRITRNSDKSPTSKVTTTNGGPTIGTNVGAKYYFSNRMAVFLEAGYGASSFGIVGLTFKL